MIQRYNASILLSLLFSWLLNGFSAAQVPHALSPDLRTLASHPEAAVNRSISMLNEQGHTGIRLDERASEGLVWIPDVQLNNGVLEVDIRGKDVLQQSFVGLAFYGQDNTTYEAIYFRPFNFHSTDPIRRVHAVQYIAHPAYTWQKLRNEFPNKYEAALSAPPNPNGWFHVRIEIQSPTIRVFVEKNTTPALVVDRLVQTGTGRVGLWVGDGSGGDFANLRVVPTR